MFSTVYPAIQNASYPVHIPLCRIEDINFLNNKVGNVAPELISISMRSG